MGQYAFGTGTITGKRNDITNPTPVLFGVCKDIQLDISRKIEKLIGQYQVPVALGAGEIDVTGKINWAKISFAAYNDLFFGASGSAAGSLQLTDLPGINASVPATPGPYTVTPAVPNSGTWASDQGVFYHNTGIQLTPVTAGSEAQGSYSVAAGVYTFSSSDQAANLDFIFGYTTSTGATNVTITNQLMGSAPTFEINCQQSFTQYGTKKIMNVKLFSCMSDKLTFPFKNAGFAEMSLGFQIQALANGNYAELSITDA